VVIAIPLLALLLATALFGVALAQAARMERVRAVTEERASILAALVANVQANQPPQSRAKLLDQNKLTSDAVIAELQAMQDQEQHLLADRQARPRRTRALPWARSP
jgi:hypothetical protein